MITEHFAWSEFDSRGTPVPEEFRQLTELLCRHVLEPLRVHLGRPIHITSGYRTPEHAQAIGAESELTSRILEGRIGCHLNGAAADLALLDRHTVEAESRAAAAWIFRNLTVKDWIDQCIWYDQVLGGHLHVAISRIPRKQFLHATIQGGRTAYIPWVPTGADPVIE
jgi:hypothetical protein